MLTVTVVSWVLFILGAALAARLAAGIVTLVRKWK